jgi:hypothetical protein
LPWLQVNLDDVEIESGSASANAAGLAVGPLIGYKLLTKSGFTFAAQGGVAYLALRGQGKSDSGDQTDAEQSTTVPLLDLNLGWSF